MLIRVFTLGLLAMLVGACAHAPDQADAVAKPESTAVSEATIKEWLLLMPVVDIHAQMPLPEPIVEAPPPAPEPRPDIWQRIRAGFRLPPMDGVLVQQQENWYASNPDYVARMVDRGSHFLYHVLEEVERRRMPTEIALLPMIESAYNPQAYSHAHAAGMWQFIPSTGKIYGLRQNFWYDGRRDVLAATSAALDYLEKLYADFGDWTLALAAYNWGEGAVSRAVARNKARGLPTDYESLAMPLETRKYVPKLQAVKNIVANPGRYGLVLANIPNQPYFATVTTRNHIDVQLAASLAEMSLEEFRFLNPAHNKPVIRANGSETLVLPIEKVAVFEKNLETHNRPLVSWHAYTVKRSDKPEKIASTHGMTLAELKEVNGLAAKKAIVPGQTILVPLRGEVDPHLPDLPAPKLAATKSKPKRAKCYVVSNNGAKKQVPCAAPTKKQPTTTKTPAKQPSSGSSTGLSVRTLTAGG